MIYTIRYNGAVISSSVGGLNEIHYNAKLTMAVNSGGTMEFTLPFGHDSYDVPQAMSGTITVWQDNKQLWGGRVVQIKIDKNLNKTFVCEGSLAILNDVQIPQTSYTLSAMLQYVNQRSEWKFSTASVITLPAVSGEESAFSRISNYVKDNGGYLVWDVADDGSVLLNWVKETTDRATQRIRFGDNLTDIALTINPDKVLTGIETQVTVKAFDKSMIDPHEERIKVFQMVRVVSKPHGVDDDMLVSKIVVDLNSAKASQIELGQKKKTLTSMI